MSSEAKRPDRRFLARFGFLSKRWMLVIASMGGVLLWAGCDYARMSEQESIRVYETAMPQMPEGTVPVQGGLQALREADPTELVNPLPGDRASRERGERAYGYFCVFCHGPRGEGYGTVGQSFSPLPTNLQDDYVQEQSDGELFYTITFGLNRMPPLADAMAEEDRWAVVHYIRSMGGGEGG